MLARGSQPWLVAAYTPPLVLAAAYVTVPNPTLLVLALALLPIALFVTWFFRDPERSPGPDVTSPADGKVLSVYADEDQTRLVIFMTPWSVHVNRSPLDGRVARLEHKAGGHLPAFKKESERNERVELDLATRDGTARLRLIAGTIARRIHPYVRAGVEVKKGERIGLIAFGSRCDLTLPGSRFRPAVGPGDWVRAGETTVARRI